MSKSVYNNSTTLLSASSQFVGVAESTHEYVELMVSMKADQNATVLIQQSSDKINWDAVDTHYYVASDSKNFTTGVVHQWFRVIVVNTSIFTQTLFRMATYFKEEYSSVASVGVDGSGVKRNILVNADGKLEVSLSGTVGPVGKSAFQVAVDEGFVGDETAWLLSLKGIQGNQGLQGIAGNDGADGATGATGLTGASGNNGVDGADGDSAYQVWLGLGNSGTQAQYIQSLKGASILVKGTLTTSEILAIDIATLSFGDSYFSSDGFSLYVWNGSTWVSSGSLRGTTGLTGLTGSQGMKGDQGANLLVLGNVPSSADLPSNAEIGHAYFVNDNFSLQVSRGAGQWATSLSLKGETGSTGATGSVGDTGSVGATGASIIAKGSVSDLLALNAIPAPSLGDLYIVEDDYKMYIYDGVAFQSSGVSMRGNTGAQGVQGEQGNTGSVGLTGNSITVMGNVANVGALPTGYDADDVGKAWFINDQFIMAVWNGSAFSYSSSLRGAEGAQGIPGVVGTTGAQGVAGSSLNYLGIANDQLVLTLLAGQYGLSDKNKAYYTLDTHALNVWDGTQWVATGSLRGQAGLQGLTGDQGATGYSFRFITNASSSLITGTIANSLGVLDTGKTYMGTDNYTLYFWNGTQFITSFPIRGAQGASGVNGTNGSNGVDGSNGSSLVAKGNVADASALSSKVATAVAGDMWFQDDVFTANVFDGTSFQSSGSLRGATGASGANATIPTPTILTYEVASGTTGGQASGINAWHPRPLNSLINSNQNGGVSLSNNVITMASTGLYKISFMSVVFQVQNNKARLYRINGMTGTIATGSNNKCHTGNSGESSNTITANLSAGDQLQLQHYISASSGLADYGAPVGSGDAELYARVVIEKLS